MLAFGVGDCRYPTILLSKLLAVLIPKIASSQPVGNAAENDHKVGKPKKARPSETVKPRSPKTKLTSAGVDKDRKPRSSKTKLATVGRAAPGAQP